MGEERICCKQTAPQIKNTTAALSDSQPDSVKDYVIDRGTLPKRVNTVLAAVLAGMLESKKCTGMESVFKQHTTRLSHHIYALTRYYGWHIERRDMAAGTSDGRVVHITTYWLPQETIAKAFEAGAREWIASVNAARAELRKHSEKCKARAFLINKSRMKKVDPRQSGFWEGA
jgi:hypothetical protein